ncbi:UNVERIFIED_CONTAM: hypothetical protein FKN15_028318 [Acipenser sinensis]
MRKGVVPVLGKSVKSTRSLLIMLIEIFDNIVITYLKKNTSLLLSVSSLAVWGTILLVARLYWMGNKPPSFSNSDNPAADSHSLLTRTLTFFYLPSINVWLLLCPNTLSFDWSMDAVPLLRNVGDWRNLHTVAFYVVLLLLAWVSLRSPSRVEETNGKACVMNGKHTGTNGKHTGTNGHSCHPDMGLPNSESRPVKSTENGIKNHVIPRTPLPTTKNIVVFSLGLLTVPFLPATNLFFYVGFVIAERVLYIPSMGFCLLVTVGMRALYIKFRRRFLKSLLLYCTATLVLLYGIKTVLRNQDWQDEEMLYKSGINVNPAKAWGNLGNVLKSQGKMAEAEKAYRNALYYRSNMADMLYNLGLLLQENKRFSQALHYYKLAIGSRPTLASAYLNTGIILMNEGRLDEAKRTFLTCAEIPDENLKDPHAHKSSVTSCLYNLGKLFHERGQNEEALSAYKEAILKMPRQFAPQSLYNMMGEAYMRLNKLTEAEHWYRESLRAKPDHIPAHLTYGKLLALIRQLYIMFIIESEKLRFLGTKKYECGTPARVGGRTLRPLQMTYCNRERPGLTIWHMRIAAGRGQQSPMIRLSVMAMTRRGQFLLEQSRLLEAAEMAGKAAQLDSTEFDVVFNAAHMLRQASLNEAAEKYYRLAAGLRPDPVRISSKQMLKGSPAGKERLIPGSVFLALHLHTRVINYLGSAHRYHLCADSGGAKMNTRCPPKRVPSAACFFTLCRLACSRLRATESEDNAALGSLQASPQVPSQTTGVAGARSTLLYQKQCEITYPTRMTPGPDPGSDEGPKKQNPSPVCRVSSATEPPFYYVGLLKKWNTLLNMF